MTTLIPVDIALPSRCTYLLKVDTYSYEAMGGWTNGERWGSKLFGEPTSTWPVLVCLCLVLGHTNGSLSLALQLLVLKPP